MTARERMALRILCSMIEAGRTGRSSFERRSQARIAVEWADALIEEAQKRYIPEAPKPTGGLTETLKESARLRLEVTRSGKDRRRPPQ